MLSQIPPSDRESEGFIVTLYLNGLQTHVRESIQYFLLPTVKENMTRALLYDSSHPSQRQNNQSANTADSGRYSSGRNYSSQKARNNGNRPDKSGDKGQSSDATGVKITAKCFHCNKLSHLKKNCFKLYPELMTKNILLKRQRYHEVSPT